MKSFFEQRQKRGASEVAKSYHGSPSKIKPNIIIVKIIQLDPYTLGAYFIKGDGGYPYYRPLIQGLEQEHDWCKNLKIGMTVRRRECGGGAGDAIKVKVKDMQLNWHIFLRFLDDHELGQSKNIAQKWGETLAGAMNYFFRKQREKDSFRNNYGQEKYVYRGIVDNIEKLSDHVVQMDVVAVAQVLFKDSIENKTAFDNEDLMELLFPGVANPDLLF